MTAPAATARSAMRKASEAQLRVRVGIWNLTFKAINTVISDQWSVISFKLLLASPKQCFFCDACLYLPEHVIDGYVCALAGGTGYEFHLAGGSLFTYIDAKRNANQVGILEFDSGALVSVIQKNIDASSVKLAGQRLADGLQAGVGDVGDGDDNRKRGNRRRQPETLVVIGLLDGRGEDALDADSVAAHNGGDFLAVGVEDTRSHRFGVLVAELEDVADFDGLADDQLAGARIDGAGLALVYAADIGAEGPGEVAARNHVALVIVELVGAADHIFAALERLVDDDGESVAERRVVVRETDRAEVPGGAAEELFELCSLHGAQFGRSQRSQQLGLVDLVVAAQEGGHALPLVLLAFGAALEGHVGHALDVGGRRDFEERGDVGDGRAPRSVDEF